MASLEGRFEDFAAHLTSPMVRLPSSRVPKRAVFCDASEIAYRAVAYFPTVTYGHIKVSFVLSNTRLAPTKTLTLPSLELQAAVVAARIKTKILEEIDFQVDLTHPFEE